MVSWVSKWLRLMSSVPANGTKAHWPLLHSGRMVSASAGCRPQSAVSGRAALGLAASGRAIARVGRAA